MPCLAAPFIAPPSFSVPGVTLGFAIPSFSPSVDFCCRIGIGPFPAIPPITIPLPITMLAPIFVTINATMLLVATFIDQTMSYLSVSCPFDN
jgi:hypothetical protein